MMPIVPIIKNNLSIIEECEVIFDFYILELDPLRKLNPSFYDQLFILKNTFLNAIRNKKILKIEVFFKLECVLCLGIASIYVYSIKNFEFIFNQNLEIKKLIDNFNYKYKMYLIENSRKYVFDI